MKKDFKRLEATGRPYDLTGERFNRLTPFKFIGKKKGRGRSNFWLCKCDCGKEIEAKTPLLINGAVGSCGCLLIDKVTVHGKSGTPEYTCWTNMKQRCLNPKNKEYKNYGDRGIFICDRWANSFENFLEDMGERPAESQSIDRIDNNDGYYKENCRWTTIKEQNKNKRQTTLHEAFGEMICIEDAGKKYGVHPTTLRYRVKSMTLEEAILKGSRK